MRCSVLFVIWFGCQGKTFLVRIQLECFGIYWLWQDYLNWLWACRGSGSVLGEVKSDKACTHSIITPSLSPTFSTFICGVWDQLRWAVGSLAQSPVRAAEVCSNQKLFLFTSSSGGRVWGWVKMGDGIHSAQLPPRIPLVINKPKQDLYSVRR